MSALLVMKRLALGIQAFDLCVCRCSVIGELLCRVDAMPNLDCAEVSLFSMQVLAFSSRYKGITAGIFSLLPWMSSFLRVAPQAVFAYAPHCSLHGKLGI